jgi:replicative DNA helicase
MEGPGQNEYEAISRLARGIKNTAKEINLPVILLCQASRKGGDGEVEISLLIWAVDQEP